MTRATSVRALRRLLAPAACLVFGACANPAATTDDERADLPVRVMVPQGPYGLALSGGGTVVATRLNGGSLVVSTLGGRATMDTVTVGVAPTGVAINAAGTEALVTNQLSSSVGVVNIASRLQVATISLGGNPFVVAYGPGGALAYATTNDGMVYAINPANRTVVDSVFTGNGANGLAFSPDGSKLYVSAFAAGQIFEINLATFVVARTFNNAGIPQGLAVSPDGSELYVANQAGRLDIWNLGNGTKQDSVVLSPAFGLAMSPDGTRLAVSLYTAGRVVQINRQSRVIVDDEPTGGDPRRLQYSASGKTLVVANLGGWIDYIR